ncbi:DNA-processing protein DprA [Gorillibacterium timonense]|uniref:DNA-processing protein DprA n=1 Tax=Gorillibacterium timonense TaxID=1689269 RepID=UPI00071C7765|nr:DNA-processing protein DprA [Gorillibacterium timonense]
MEQRTVLLALQEIKGVGWKTILRFVSELEDLNRLFDMNTGELMSLGIPESKATGLLTALNGTDWTRLEERYADKSIRAVTLYDEEYPALLKETSQPPWVLYTIGRIELLQHPCIAVVGTRTPTAYGVRTAEELGRILDQAGAVAVSGLARGIDGAVHRGALEGNGSTLAVVGGGPDVIYPPEHKQLYAELAKRGLILSEFPPGTRIAPGLFPLRNRIIAGLSLATVVVEAALRSGSLITADQALDESRDVFAVPGPISSPKSRGTNELIRQGARIVTEPADIIREYASSFASSELALAASSSRVKLPELTKEEAELLARFPDGPVTIDTLLEGTQTNFGHLHELLLNLVLTKRIKALPGAAYAKIED